MHVVCHRAALRGRAARLVHRGDRFQGD